MGRFAAKAAQGKFSNKVVTTYKLYLDNPERAKQDNPVRNRPPSIPLYISPFSFDLTAAQTVKVSASQTVISSRLTHVNAGGVRALASMAPNTTALRVGEFRAARVIISTGRQATGIDKISKTSGLPYKSYGGNTESIPFGRKDSGEDQAQAFAAIKLSIQGSTITAATPRVTLMIEKYRP